MTKLKLWQSLILNSTQIGTKECDETQNILKRKLRQNLNGSKTQVGQN